MSKNPGAIKATKVTEVKEGQCYSMWEGLKSDKWIPVKILHWAKRDAPDHPIAAPNQLTGMDPTTILKVLNLTTGETLIVTDCPGNDGAVFYGDKRATFHKICSDAVAEQ